MRFLATAIQSDKVSQVQQAPPLLPGQTLAGVPWQCSQTLLPAEGAVLPAPDLNWYLQCSGTVLGFLFALHRSSCAGPCQMWLAAT